MRKEDKMENVKEEEYERGITVYEEDDVAYEGNEGVDCGLYLVVVILWVGMCGL